MKIGVEINMIVKDSLIASKLYEKAFKAEIIEATSYEKGLNEVIFKIFDTQFHLLDENKEYGLYAPTKDKTNSMWCNLFVEDIEAIFNRCEEERFQIIQPITKLEEFGIINAIVSDPFSYQWMFHQVIKDISFQERCEIMEEMMKK